jgi:hypothetical protein
LIYSSYSSSYARPKPNYSSIECHKGRESSTGPAANQYKCCYGEVNSYGQIQHWYCADCTKKADSSYACGAYTEVFLSGGQGGGVIEQPPTPKKHGGTVLPKGGGVLENPSTDQGTNSKKGNDNSPTPPACPDKGPIPPNCTLKPKF